MPNIFGSRGNKKIYNTAIVLALFYFCLPLAHASASSIKVATTIPAYVEIIEAIGGDKVIVESLIPANSDPHTYEPHLHQMASLEEVDLYIKVGADFDFENHWLEKLIQFNNNMIIVDSSKNIDLIDVEHGHHHHHHHDGHHENSKDPHVWVSLHNCLIIAENIYNVLSEHDIDNSAYYRQRANIYKSRVKKLINRFNATTSNKKQVMIALHDAWRYFARDFNIELYIIEQESKEPSIRDLAYIIDIMKKNDVKTIFISPQFSARFAQTIARDTQAKLIPIDHVSEDFLSNMQVAIDQFSN